MFAIWELFLVFDIILTSAHFIQFLWYRFTKATTKT